MAQTQSTYTLEVENIFVSLRVRPTVPGAANADPIRAGLSDAHGPWAFLATLQHNLVITGAPGSGKTTLL